MTRPADIAFNLIGRVILLAAGIALLVMSAEAPKDGGR